MLILHISFINVLFKYLWGVSITKYTCIVYYKRRCADVPKKKFSDSCSRHERVIVAILAFKR